MKFRLLLFTFLGLILSFQTLFAQESFTVLQDEIEGFGNIEYAEGRLIVSFLPTVTDHEVSMLSEAVNVRRSEPLEFIDAKVWEFDGLHMNEALAILNGSDAVIYAEPDFVYRLPETVKEPLDFDQILNDEVIPNDQHFGVMWGLKNTGQSPHNGVPGADISATQAWQITTGSPEVIIAVFDSGIDYEHPDLIDNLWFDENGNAGISYLSNEPDPMDLNGHGTHVAGTIAARGNNGIGITGVNWEAKIINIKICNQGGSCLGSAAIQGLQYSINNGAFVSNHSYGGAGSPSNAILNAFQNAADAGHLIVAAAGNDNTNNDNIPFYPAGYQVDNVISVASSTPNDTRSSFSNFGASSVHLAAPGSSIASTDINASGYSYKSGTSMASPHVAGAAALLKAANPDATYSEIRNWIFAGVDQIPAFENNTITGGRMNLYNSMLIATLGPPQATLDTDPIEQVGYSGQNLTRDLGLSNNSDGILSYNVAVLYDDFDWLNREPANPIQIANRNGTEFIGLSSVGDDFDVTPLSESNFSSGFEASEGYETGFIGGQNGWTALSGNTSQPVVSEEMAESGSRSLKLGNHSSLGGNTNVGARTPIISTGSAYYTMELDIFVEDTGGSDYDIVLQSPTLGQLTTRMRFSSNGNVQVVQRSGNNLNFVTVGSYSSAQWINVRKEFDTAEGEVRYFVDGDLIHTGASLSGTTEQVVVLHNNNNDGESAFVDNVSLSGSDGWLTVTPEAGLLEGVNSEPLSLGFDTSVNPGVYNATLIVSTNDPELSLVEIPVSFELIGTPETPKIAVSKSELSVVMIAGEQTEKTLMLQNVGQEELTYTSDVEGQPVLFSLSPSSGSISFLEESAVTLNIDASGVEAGSFQNTIIFDSNDPDEPQKEVLVDVLILGGMPDAVALEFPEENAEDVDQDVTFVWEAGEFADSYRLQVADNPEFNLPAFNSGGIEETQAEVTGLSANTVWYWRVKGRNAAGTGEWSDTRSFSTTLTEPGIIVLTHPENQAEGVEFTPTFTWDADDIATGYHFQLATDSSFEEPLADEINLGENEFTIITSLDAGQAYFWRVRAENESISGDWSEVFVFTTETATSLEDEEVPTAFSLEQNYPNPFNPTTLISYDLPESATVRLDVFNVMGQRVATLVNEHQNAGRFTVNFDASTLASGVYIYRIQAGSFMETRKMMLVK